MRVVVNLTRCQGYAQCAFLAPDVFRMRGDEALVYDPEPDDAQREPVLRAAAACPVQTVRVDRMDGGAPAASAFAASAMPSRPVPQPRAVGPAARGGRDAAMEAFRRSGRIVIVGASLAGLAAAATLRREGFTGSLTMIGEEPYQPYDRPPLSKQVLEGWITPEHTRLPCSDEVDARWLLGVPATGLDVVGTQVRLGDGGTVDYDRLLIATGTRARPWFNDAEAALDGVFVLRTRDDTVALRQRLADRPRRVLVIGAGFTDHVVIAQGSVAKRRFVAAYGYQGRITAAVAFNQGKWLEFYQNLIEAAAPFPPHFGPADRQPVPAQLPDRQIRDRHATVVVTGHDPATIC